MVFYDIRSMTSCDLKIKCIFMGPKNVHRYLKTIKTCSKTQGEHTGRYIFALAQSESKLLAKAISSFWAFDLTSEVTGWPRTLRFMH